MNKEQLISLIKECFVEILAEGKKKKVTPVKGNDKKTKAKDSTVNKKDVSKKKEEPKKVVPKKKGKVNEAVLDMNGKIDRAIANSIEDRQREYLAVDDVIKALEYIEKTYTDNEDPDFDSPDFDEDTHRLRKNQYEIEPIKAKDGSYVLEAYDTVGVLSWVLRLVPNQKTEIREDIPPAPEQKEAPPQQSPSDTVKPTDGKGPIEKESPIPTEYMGVNNAIKDSEENKQTMEVAVIDVQKALQFIKQTFGTDYEIEEEQSPSKKVIVTGYSTTEVAWIVRLRKSGSSLEEKIILPEVGEPQVNEVNMNNVEYIGLDLAETPGEMQMEWGNVPDGKQPYPIDELEKHVIEQAQFDVPGTDFLPSEFGDNSKWFVVTNQGEFDQWLTDALRDQQETNADAEYHDRTRHQF